MPKKYFWSLVAILVAIILAMVFFIVPGGDAARHVVGNFVWNTLIVGGLNAAWWLFLMVIIFVLPWVLGFFGRLIGLEMLDDLILHWEDMSMGQVALVGFLFSIITGLLHICIAWLIIPNTVIATTFGQWYWQTSWEVAPFNWGWYGGIGAAIGFIIGWFFDPDLY